MKLPTVAKQQTQEETISSYTPPKHTIPEINVLQYLISLHLEEVHIRDADRKTIMMQSKRIESISLAIHTIALRKAQLSNIQLGVDLDAEQMRKEIGKKMIFTMKNYIESLEHPGAKEFDIADLYDWMVNV